MNQDGNLDLVVVPYDRDVSDPKQLLVTVLLGDGKGGFKRMTGPSLPLAGCLGPDRVATGDIDGDGFRDIVVTCAQNNKLMIYRGSKEGTFRSSARGVQTGWSGLAVADLNGDGNDEIVVSNGSTGSEPNPRTGTVTIFFIKK